MVTRLAKLKAENIEDCLVGKPNVEKSTFSAATLKVDIANYPFCTIDANVGVAFIKLDYLVLVRNFERNRE